MSDDPVDITTMDEASANAVTEKESLIKCSYCGCLKDGVLMFYCDQCHIWVHSNCLQSGPPSALLADNYYIFKCTNCSADKKEEFERMKLTWVQVVTLALYNLGQTNMGKQGCFKWKEDICVFIEKHFECLFGPDKKKSQWNATVASVLSAGNPHRFQSGYSQFGETGWWRLVDPTKSPEFQPRSATTPSVARGRSSRKTHFGMMSRYTSRKRQHASLALQVLETKAKQACFKETSETTPEVSLNKSARKAKTKVNVKTEASCKNGSLDSHASNSPADLSLPESPASSFSNDSRAMSIKDGRVDPLLPLAAISDEENDNFLNEMSRDDEWGIPEDSEAVNNGDVMDTNYAERSHVKPIQAKPITLKPMSLYDEHKLLKKLLSLPSTDNSVQARCLRRKLLLRQKKRELGIPVFNFDATVRRLHAKEKGLTLDMDDPSDVALPHYRSTEYRILDRFLVQDLKFGKIKDDSRSFLQKLVGSDEADALQHIVSPYTQRVLKPYIRRDYETKPAKLKLLEEVVSHYHRSNPNWQAGASSIDYCYVHPRHIPTINALCRHFFWPGVDLSESLQYPDFSVVALYKKMVIGFGFLVPDVAFNESYISFLLVHPDWQRAGIGSFMLYHLIQTCMGKDLTLHVSASNPAMLLYQRFGFKPERFEADFYDKYLPVDTQDCSHAFFLRLQR